MYLCYALSYAYIDSNIFVNLILSCDSSIIWFNCWRKSCTPLHSSLSSYNTSTTPNTLLEFRTNDITYILHSWSYQLSWFHVEMALPHSQRWLWNLTSLIAEVMKLPSLSLIEMICSLMMHFLLHWPSLTFTWLQWSTLLKQPTDATFSMMSLDLTDCQNWNQNWTLCSTHK